MGLGPKPRLAVLRFPPIGTPAEDEWLTSTEMPPGAFAAHLDTIRSLRWEPIDAETLVDGLDRPAAMPARAVVLTFDGGYRSLLTDGLEPLRKKRWPAVAFVPTGRVGLEAALEKGDDRARPICDWGELVTLASHGVSIHSMGTSDRGFRRLDPPERESEIRRSSGTIEERLGEPPTLFAYPGGRPGSDAIRTDQALGRAGYRAAFVLGGGPEPVPVADRFRIGRIEVGVTTDLERELSI